MSEKIKKFENRIGTNLNRKVFEVDEVQTDHSGNITKIKGELLRDDDCINTGTPLNATTFNELLKLTDLALKKYYNANDLVINWTQSKGELQEATLKINTTERLEAVIDLENISDYLDVVATSTNNEISITIKEKEALNLTTGSTERVFNFDIYLFMNDIDIRIGKVGCAVTYVNTSVAPID